MSAGAENRRICRHDKAKPTAQRRGKRVAGVRGHPCGIGRVWFEVLGEPGKL